MFVVATILMILAQASPAPLPLTPLAAKAWDAWRGKAAACKAPLGRLPKAATVARSLAVRVAAEQCLRGLLDDPVVAALPDADGRAVGSRMWGEISPVDAANTAWLKTVIPADGWFRASRDGAETASNAWLIVQHSPDEAFQREVLRRMEPLAKAGEVKGGDYALLYDRVEMFAGRPQYYGSQYRCVNGRWAPYTLRDPAGVEARRKALGMSSMAENGKRFPASARC